MNHFYPGMGATGAMYSGRWRDVDNSEFHDWPKYTGESSISELACKLIEVHRIQKGDTVVGTSLGGIVACEIANQIELKRLILIGSAVSKKEISGLLRLLHPLVDLAPLEFIRFSAGSLPSDLSAMFSESEPEFIRRMCKAVFQWEGLKADVELLRIHGKHDKVIPLPVGTPDPIEGGHLIVMTHAEECVSRMRL